MAKKEYTLKINGLSENVDGLTSVLDVLKAIDAQFQKTAKATTIATKSSKEHKSALSDEEKAAKKLEDTQKKIKAAQEGANDAQAKANQALREATREQMLRIKAEQSATNSIEEMRVKLSQLKDEWKGLDVGTEEFRNMSDEIRVLNDRIKEAEQSTGDFRRNVGNYESALGGLEKLSDGFDTASKTSMGFAQSLLATNQLLGLFGSENEETREQTKQLQKVLALLAVTTQINNNLIKENIKHNTLATAADKIRTVQMRAKAAAEAASTKGTIAATAAQKIFNAVAAANPYVLLALALAGVVAGLAVFVSSSGRAKSAEEKHKQAVDALTRSIEENGREIDRRSEKLRALGKSDLVILESEREARRLIYNEAKGLLDEYEAKKARGQKINEEEMKQLRESAEATKEAYDESAAKADNHYTRIETRIRDHNKTEAQLRTERYENERKGATHSNEKLLALEKEYQLDMQEIRKRGATQTADAAKGERDKLIEELANYGKAEIQLLTEKYDKEYDLLQGNAEVQNTLTRRYLDDRKALEEKAEQEREAIEKKSVENLKAAQAERMKVVDLSLSATELSLTQSLNRIGDIIERDSDGLQLIDVKATRDNLKAVNGVLDEYVEGVKKYQGELTAAHVMALQTLKAGTPEYIEETQRYAWAMEDATTRINNALAEQKNNLKSSGEAWTEYFTDLFGKIGNIASGVSDAITSITDTLNMGLQVQLDDLSNQLDIIGERYEEAKKYREETVKSVEDLEEQLQAATGGTAVALREQLQDAMHARAEAEREEKRIAREKEKLEADIAKKEKQARRNDLIAKIAQGFANTALGITQALSTVPIPLNFVVAGIVGTMGLVQTGMMTKQLTKLADGGEIVGPSHANGGVPVKGTNYEVEGGEFVVNKRSYGANANLINFINDTPRAITAADLIGVMPGDATPVSVTDAGQAGEDRVIEAINGINVRPVVSVTDINNVDDEVVTVQDLAGF